MKAAPDAGVVFLAELVRRYQGDTILVAEHLARVLTALSVEVTRAAEHPDPMGMRDAIFDEVELWMTGHEAEYGGAEWILAASILMAAVVDRAKATVGEKRSVQ